MCNQKIKIVNKKFIKTFQLLSVVTVVGLSSCKKDRIDPKPPIENSVGNSESSSPSSSSMETENANYSPDTILDVSAFSNKNLRAEDLTATPITSVNNTSIYKKQGNNAFFYQSSLFVDASGALKAFHQNSSLALAELTTAGQPGNWWGLVTDNGKENGTPIIQKETDPAPGYYVSTTALFYANRPTTDPRKYVNSTVVPYIGLPEEVRTKTGAKLGDFVAVINKKTGAVSYGILGQISGAQTVGSGSITLARKVGANSNPKAQVSSDQIVYLVFPGSGNGKPRTLFDIRMKGAALLRSFGGGSQLLSFFNSKPPQITPPVTTGPTPATPAPSTPAPTTPAPVPPTNQAPITPAPVPPTSPAPVTPAPVPPPAASIPPSNAPAVMPGKAQISSIAGVNVYRKDGNNAFFYKSGLMVDADGSPRCYHPNDAVALDNLEMAGYNGNWWALATDNMQENGTPLIQKSSDPAPGFYVSMTSLFDGSKPYADPARYVNAEVIPYMVIPASLKNATNAQLGDYAAIINTVTGKITYGVFADVGPEGKIGEASMKAAEEVGVNNNPKTGGTHSKEIIYIVFPGSSDGFPKSVPQIHSKGKSLLDNWGGAELLKNLLNNNPI